jgi:hypothetical protein
MRGKTDFNSTIESLWVGKRLASLNSSKGQQGERINTEMSVQVVQGDRERPQPFQYTVVRRRLIEILARGVIKISLISRRKLR